MAFEGRGAFPLTPAGILAGAPEEAGVYAIHTPARWVFIADSDNIRQALFDQLNAPGGPLDSFQPLSFSFATAPHAECRALRDALVAGLRPVCNDQRAPASADGRRLVRLPRAAALKSVR